MAYIKISNVSKNYKDGENVYLALKNINLELDKNEFVAILGESGSGKSTLLNLLIGISEITSGNIYINNENLRFFSKKRMNHFLKNEVGVIFQKYNLIDLYNIYDNIDIIRNKNINKGKIHKLLESIGISKKIYNRINESSGGELQRVAAIRAIINNPSLIICDEPTGALDSENSEKLMNYLLSIKENKLIIMVTHNKELATKYATRIIELKDGKVIKDSKNHNQNTKINENHDLQNHKLSLNHKLIFIKNLINKKKGRFLISIISCVFLLFFMSSSLMTINAVNEYINFSFLSSLDANVLDLKSYEVNNKELKEVEVPTIITKELNNNPNYFLRKNYNKYLNDKLLDNLEFKNDNKKINFNGAKLCCMSIYSKTNLKLGEKPINANEVIINENLYNYISTSTSIINQRIKLTLENDVQYLKIKGVSYNSLMNDSLVIYFDYNLINKYLDNKIINDYQLDIKNIDLLDTIINQLKESKLYIEKDQLINNEINFSLEYSNDLNNYYLFYELINLAKIVVYFFLGIMIAISILLLSNVLYSFNEEEKRNLALLKVLGNSFKEIGSISIILGIIIATLSFIINLLINKYIEIYLSPLINNLLNINKDLDFTLTLNEKIIIYFLILFISLLSSIFPLIKLRFMKIDKALKEE